MKKRQKELIKNQLQIWFSVCIAHKKKPWNQNDMAEKSDI